MIWPDETIAYCPSPICHWQGPECDTEMHDGSDRCPDCGEEIEKEIEQ